jgi:hypothetical protein
VTHPSSGIDRHSGHDAYEATQDGEKVEIDGADTILVAHDGRLRQIIVFDGAHPPVR